MSKLVAATAILVLAGLSPVHARGGHSSSSALSAPANPSVPPSLASDPRMIGSAPLPSERPPTRAAIAALSGIATKPDPEDAKVDRMIKSICRGC